jgi:hypothetical protein
MIKFINSLAWVFGIITLVFIAIKITAWKEHLKEVAGFKNKEALVDRIYVDNLKPWVAVTIVCWCWIIFS